MVFLVFKASIALKITVEVGLVTGVTPAITPLGSAILVKPNSLSSSIYADGLFVTQTVPDIF